MYAYAFIILYQARKKQSNDSNAGYISNGVILGAVFICEVQNYSEISRGLDWVALLL